MVRSTSVPLCSDTGAEARDGAVEHGQRQGAVGQDGAVEGARVEAVAELGLGAGAQPADLPPSTTCRPRLAGQQTYLSTSLTTCSGVVAVCASMNSTACSRDQPIACIPVSTTSRQARSAAKLSIPNSAVSLEYRPISSARDSAYRPQPSLKLHASTSRCLR